MIVFDLKCAGEHIFEAWFASSAAFAEQRDNGLIACPVCGVTAVNKAIMAPRVGAKGNTAGAAPADARALMTTLLSRIAAAQAEALPSSRWVGRRFADEARAMHEGEQERATIHGQATPEEAQALVGDGVTVMPLLVPVVPPDKLN